MFRWVQLLIDDYLREKSKEADSTDSIVVTADDVDGDNATDERDVEHLQKKTSDVSSGFATTVLILLGSVNGRRVGHSYVDYDGARGIEELTVDGVYIDEEYDIRFSFEEDEEDDLAMGWDEFVMFYKGEPLVICHDGGEEAYYMLYK